MTTLYAALSGAFLLGTAALCPAQTPSMPAGSTMEHPVNNARIAASSEYRADKGRIEADYKEAKAGCKSMSGNAKDVCMAKAKGDENVAKAELENRRKGTAHSQYEVSVAKAKAQYDVAKEKCDDMSGKEKSACKKQAKADEDQALAEAKSNRQNMAKSGK
jgi:hypothetical protein